MNLALTETKDLFDALGDRLRLRLACCLLTVKEGLCVCELVEALKVSQPNASRHLRLMKAAGLVNEERDGLLLCRCPRGLAAAPVTPEVAPGWPVRRGVSALIRAGKGGPL